ncbi:hypothetical protein GHJ48_13375 [Acinetobacter sp. dk771]|uniref:Uncharacterized protein n=1 Tax=Acinetobacter wanghuae TaxID=2662362 RepID=A0AA90W793_9GAMM|nr:hypothetical protein [Acinetobacter wanghuae]MQW93366.1 hypothetical protein [Acinetobacter wanghuae]
MSAVNLINEDDEEREIAFQAACALREAFISAAQSGPVMYVENDNLILKDPNGPPIVIKHLSGRNPELAQRVASRGTFKINRK